MDRNTRTPGSFKGVLNQKRSALKRSRTGVPGPSHLGVLAAVLAVVLAGVDCARAVVGGAPVASGAIARPVVGLVGPRNSFCTATAISRDLVLTAGHCAEPGTRYAVQFRSAAGVRQLGQSATIERPPQFKMGPSGLSTSADLALVKLAGPLPSRIGTAALGLASPAVWPGDLVLMVGGGIPFPGLRETGVNRTALLVAVGPYLRLQMLLNDPLRKHVGACAGDSGSPVFDIKNAGAKVVGVVSWAGGPGNTKGCGGLTGATPLAPYRAWIEQTIDKLDNNDQ